MNEFLMEKKGHYFNNFIIIDVVPGVRRRGNDGGSCAGAGAGSDESPA